MPTTGVLAVTVPGVVDGWAALLERFGTLPLCASADQIGCVVTYVSFRVNSPPPAGGGRGRATMVPGSFHLLVLEK